MADNFDLSLKYVLQDEGGNSDDPRDPGGRTSRGITQREYNSWAHVTGKPEQQDVWNASDDEIRTIYHDQYWMPYCDSMPAGLDYLFFDISVNAGRSQAVKTFQRAVGVTVDGMFGQVTKSAILSLNPTQLINSVSENRREFYRHLKNFSIYGHGWLNRVDHSEKAALAMVQNVPHDKIATPSVKATDPATTAIDPAMSATATGGMMAVLAGFKDQIQSLSDSIPSLKYVILGIAAIGLGYTVYGMYRNNKIAQAT